MQNIANRIPFFFKKGNKELESYTKKEVSADHGILYHHYLDNELIFREYIYEHYKYVFILNRNKISDDLVHYFRKKGYSIY